MSDWVAVIRAGLTPSFLNLLLRWRRSPTASRKSILRTKARVSKKPKINRVHTPAWGIDDNVEVDFKKSVLVSVDDEFIVTPAPHVLCDIIQDEKNTEDNDKDGHESSKLGACLVGGWELWERVKRLDRRNSVELLDE